MVCSDPRKSDKERARAALEKMDDGTLAEMVKLIEEAAKKHPRPQAKLTLVAPNPKKK